ncbi:MAG: hypothetical protein EHM18_06545 [Acidobacteria bacterium]|nr:MAG: hypothetical protein EHM18_06545 [Acidobacteriota bacterium]
MTMATQTSDKIDFSKTHKDLYTASQKIKEVEAGPAVFLSVKGQGEPGGAVFQKAIEKMYSMVYTAKFLVMKPRNADFKVSNLEALWFLTDPENTPKDQWKWQLLIRIPEALTSDDLARTAEEVRAKRGVDPSDVERITWDEGKAVQLMHIGPYDKVGESYQKLDQYAREHGLTPKCPGHEIYISDPRRVAPEKIKTIVRLPVGRQ